MNQLLKILLDHPDKIERFFLWFLQSAIIIWGMSFFIGFNIFQLKSVNSSLEINFIGQLTALRLATYLLIFVTSWITVWFLFADIIILILLSLLNWIIRKIRFILWYLFITVLYPILFLLSCIKIIPKPKPLPFLKKNDDDETYKPNEFHSKTQQLTKDLEFFFEINKLTKSAKGSEYLLEIISFEKSEFIRSRIIRYYTIIVIISIIQLNVFNFSNHITIKVFLLLILFVIGLIIYGLNVLYTKLSQNVIFYLKPRLEFTVFQEHIKDSLFNSLFIGDYYISMKRKYFILNLKEPENELMSDYFKTIKVIPVYERINSSFLELNDNDASNTLIIYISETIPSIDIRKSIELNHQCLLVASNQEEILDGILKIYPIVSGDNKII